MSTIATNTRKTVAGLRAEDWIGPRRHSASHRISPEDLAQDRAFWTALLDLRSRRCPTMSEMGGRAEGQVRTG